MAQPNMQFESSPVTQGRVLLVEDDDDTRATLCEALEELGFEVEARGDGAAGFEQAAQHDFNVVLTDLKMPKMDGIELCQRLSGDRPNLPVVLMTAFGDLETALGALRAGAFDFIIKPFTVDQVVEALRRAMKHAAQSASPVRSAPEGESGAANPSRRGDKDTEPNRHRESLEEVERRHILLVLDAVSWNKAEAARTLGIDRATLYRKLRRYGIDAPS